MWNANDTTKINYNVERKCKINYNIDKSSYLWNVVQCNGQGKVKTNANSLLEEAWHNHQNWSEINKHIRY